MIQTIDNFFQEVYYMPSDEEYRRLLGFFSNERHQIREMFKKLSWDASEDEQTYKVILNNSQWFKSYDYEDLKGQIKDLCIDAKLQIER